MSCPWRVFRPISNFRRWISDFRGRRPRTTSRASSGGIFTIITTAIRMAARTMVSKGVVRINSSTGSVKT